MTLFKKIFGGKPTQEYETSDDLSFFKFYESSEHFTAIKLATKILTEHIDAHELQFRANSEPLFDVGNKVIVNKYGIGKSNSNSWDGGALNLLRCIGDNVTDETPIYAEITSVRVTAEWATKCIGYFLGQNDFNVTEEVKNTFTLCEDFDRWLKTTSEESPINMYYGLYWNYGFTTNTDFNPEWGLNGNAFHFTSAEEGKATLEKWEKEIEDAL